MILYFSATGNSKYCAEFLAAKTSDKIISLNGMMKNDVREINCAGEKNLGIIAPTYDFELAYAVADFLERLVIKNLGEKVYVYSVFTCGSTSGESENNLRKILAAKNINLNAAFVVVMPDNYVLMFKQKSLDEKNKMLAQADVKLKEISEIITAQKNIPANPKKSPRIITWLIEKFFIPSQKKIKGFSVNENCVACGLCEKICPMNIIKLQDNHPVWTKNNCACCLACLHRCPKQAINRGKSFKNGRYLNPNVSL